MDVGRGVTGVALVALGGVFLLDQAGAVDAGSIVAAWWPVLFLVAAAFQALARPPQRSTALVLAAVGVALLALTTGVLGSWFWAVLWPSAIVAAGLLVLARAGRPASPPAGDRSATDMHGDDVVDVVAVLSGRTVIGHGDPFRGGRATAVLGSVELDLLGARIDPLAELDLVAVLGGVEVVVPTGWRVRLAGPAVLGSHEVTVPEPDDPDAPTLRIRATSVLGGVEVTARSVPARTTARDTTWPRRATTDS